MCLEVTNENGAETKGASHQGLNGSCISSVPRRMFSEFSEECSQKIVLYTDKFQ